MTREEKCQMAIEKGFTYNPQTGKIYGIRGKEITNKLNKGYIRFQFNHIDKIYRLKGHQFGWYWVNKECVEQIDHINGVKDDNRICNLRSVTNQENAFNRKAVKGYSWHKIEKKWRARIMINNKSIHLGDYKTEEEARQAYLVAKEKYHII